MEKLYPRCQLLNDALLLYAPGHLKPRLPSRYPPLSLRSPSRRSCKTSLSGGPGSSSCKRSARKLQKMIGPSARALPPPRRTSASWSSAARPWTGSGACRRRRTQRLFPLLLSPARGGPPRPPCSPPPLTAVCPAPRSPRTACTTRAATTRRPLRQCTSAPRPLPAPLGCSSRGRGGGRRGRQTRGPHGVAPKPFWTSTPRFCRRASALSSSSCCSCSPT